MLNTLNILPRIFGEHISHDPIPLDFGLVSDQFTKEVLSKTHKRAFRNLGVDQPYFRSLDSGKSLGFFWVFLPMLSICKLLQGCSCVQSDLGGLFKISLVSFFLHEMEKRNEVLHILFPSAPLPKRLCLDSPLGILILTVSHEVLRSRPFLDTAYGMGGRQVTCPFLQSASLNS